VFYGLLLFVLCLVYPMFTVALDCPFLIVPSVFFNVYLRGLNVLIYNLPRVSIINFIKYPRSQMIGMPKR